MFHDIFSISRMIITLVFVAFLMTLVTGYEAWISKNVKAGLEVRGTASSAASMTSPSSVVDEASD